MSGETYSTGGQYYSAHWLHLQALVNSAIQQCQ